MVTAPLMFAGEKMTEDDTMVSAELLARLDAPLVRPLVPIAARNAVDTLWALDTRLAALAYQGREPALRAIRLKWWEQQLTDLMTHDVKPPDPLLAQCKAALSGVADGAALGELAFAWADADDEAGERGAILFSLSVLAMGGECASVSIEHAGRAWAMTDRLLREPSPSDEQWRQAARAFAATLKGLPRPLAAITALHRTIARGGGQRRRLREQAVLLRVGLLGR